MATQMGRGIRPYSLVVRHLFVGCGGPRGMGVGIEAEGRLSRSQQGGDMPQGRGLRECENWKK